MRPFPILDFWAFGMGLKDFLRSVCRLFGRDEAKQTPPDGQNAERKPMSDREIGNTIREAHRNDPARAPKKRPPATDT